VEFETKLEWALTYLDGSGINHFNYAPPFYRFLWRLRLKVPPPHFAGFATNFVITAPFLGVAWGLAMRFVAYRDRPVQLAVAIILPAVFGIICGVGIAAYYQVSARRHSIPEWKQFNPREAKS